MGPLTGYRYVDDYEMTFDSHSEAEEALARLQEALTEFGLALNPNKTQIVDLPRAINPQWVAELGRFIFRGGGRVQQSDLMAYFDRAFELSWSFPQIRF